MGCRTTGLARLGRTSLLPPHRHSPTTGGALVYRVASQTTVLTLTLSWAQTVMHQALECCMSDLPTGTVTFLFTDLESSTILWDQHRDAMRQALIRHDVLVEQVVAEHAGQVVRPRGEGDSRFAVFARATDAVAAAAALQQALSTEPWPTPTPLRVRMALHTGEADLREGDYYGSAVNRCARLRAVAHGGQTLVSLPTEQLVREQLTSGLALHDLGAHRLKDLQHSERVFQLIIDGIPADFPPLKTLDARPNNLPVQLTSFIGRDQEVEAVCARLREPHVRLVTLTAPGGSGKTRLALQVAAELLDDFPDGVWFVDLAPVREPALVASAIAEPLGVTEAPGQPLAERLTTVLRDRRLLLVLDNFEQVAAAAPLVDAVLRAAPGLKVLVTSRVVLRVYGEHDVQVPPLALPDVTHLPPLDHLIHYAAIRLFCERAQAVSADFRLTPETAPAIAAICQRLDGLPLAIELAAARIRLLPPQALLQRLSSRLKVLTGGALTLPPRQQTLRDAIGWSHDLLDSAERTLFRRLAVFVGGWTLEAAEAVCKADGMLGLDVLDGLQSLLNKSLVREAEHLTDDPRFTMLETIREYAVEHLVASGEHALLRQAHAQFYLTVVETAERSRSTPARPVWLQRLLLDQDNLRAALTWSRDAGDGDMMLRLAGALQWFWNTTDSYSEGRQWLDAAVQQDDTRDTASSKPNVWWRARAKAIYGAGNMAQVLGDSASGQRYYAESAELFRAVGDKEGLARALNGLGMVAGDRGDFAASRAFQEESVSLLRELGLTPDLAWSLMSMAGATMELGDYGAARLLLEEGHTLYQAVGDQHGVGVALNGLAKVAFRQNEMETARRLCGEGLAIMRELDSRWWIADYLMAFGDVATAEGDDQQAIMHYQASLAVWYGLGILFRGAEVLRKLGDVALRKQAYEQAQVHYGEALEVSTASGDSASRAWSLCSLAQFALQQGNAPRAQALVQEALGLFSDAGDHRGISVSLEELARLAIAKGQAERAARLLATADTRHRRKVGSGPLFDRDAYEATFAAVHAHLDDAVFAAAWAEGQAMTLEQAVAYALEDAPDG